MSDELFLEAEKLAKALRYYARENNWGKDDWGVQSVIQQEYGAPGRRAKRALAAWERFLAEAEEVHSARTEDT